MIGETLAPVRDLEFRSSRLGRQKQIHRQRSALLSDPLTMRRDDRKEPLRIMRSKDGAIVPRGTHIAASSGCGIEVEQRLVRVARHVEQPKYLGFGVLFRLARQEIQELRPIVRIQHGTAKPEVHKPVRSVLRPQRRETIDPRFHFLDIAGIAKPSAERQEFGNRALANRAFFCRCGQQ